MQGWCWEDTSGPSPEGDDKDTHSYTERRQTSSPFSHAPWQALAVKAFITVLWRALWTRPSRQTLTVRSAGRESDLTPCPVAGTGDGWETYGKRSVPPHVLDKVGKRAEHEDMRRMFSF
ncbi:hypothetical protein AOLI_G00248120 [Acnodon oligacanthus]